MLTTRQFRFVLEYCKHENATKAAESAGYEPVSAHTTGCRLLKNEEVLARIAERRAELAVVAQLTPEWVLKQWFDIASANPDDIVKIKVSCCAQCYDDETCAVIEAAGLGDTLNNPNPDCILCYGQGIKTMIITDTRRLSGAARRLFAGAQQTKDGIKVLFRDQDAALANLSKYLGMIVDKKELSGPGGGPVPVATVNVNELTDAQLMALCAGRNAMDGGIIEGTLNLAASNP